MASLIDNLKGLLWKETVAHNNYSGTNSKNLWRMLLNNSYSVELHRSNHQRYSKEKGVLENFTRFTRKHMCQSLFLNKVVGLRSVTLLRKRLRHRCFPVNFVKRLKTPTLKNISERLAMVAGWKPRRNWAAGIYCFVLTSL